MGSRGLGEHRKSTTQAMAKRKIIISMGWKARSSTLVETNVVPQTSTLNAPNKCPCILLFSCMIFSFSAKTGGYGLTQFSCPANALYGAGLK